MCRRHNSIQMPLLRCRVWVGRRPNPAREFCITYSTKYDSISIVFNSSVPCVFFAKFQLSAHIDLEGLQWNANGTHSQETTIPKLKSPLNIKTKKTRKQSQIATGSCQNPPNRVRKNKKQSNPNVARPVDVKQMRESYICKICRKTFRYLASIYNHVKKKL